MIEKEREMEDQIKVSKVLNRQEGQSTIDKLKKEIYDLRRDLDM